MSDTVFTAYKARARRLGAALSKRHIEEIPHGTLLEIIAEVEGHQSWAALRAAVSASQTSPAPPEAVGAAATDSLAGTDAANYLRLFADLMDLGVMSQDGITIAAEKLPLRCQWVAHQMRETVFQGSSYQEAFAEAGFPRFVGPLLAAGINGGNFAASLRAMAAHLENEGAIRLKRRHDAAQFFFPTESDFINGYSAMLQARQSEIRDQPFAPLAVTRILRLDDRVSAEEHIVRFLAQSGDLRLRLKVGHEWRDPSGPHGVFVGEFATHGRFLDDGQRVIFETIGEFTKAADDFETARRKELSQSMQPEKATLRIRADELGLRAAREPLGTLVTMNRELRLQIFVNDKEVS